MPAEHITTIDHDMQLPNGLANPKRRFSGQQFFHHHADAARWMLSRLAGFDSRDTTIAAHTQKVAGVHVLKANGARVNAYLTTLIFCSALLWRGP